MTVSLLPTRLCSAACRDTGFNRVFSLAWAFTPQFYQLHLKVHSSQALNKQSSFLPWNVGKAPWAKHEVNRTHRDMHSCSCSGWDLSDCWAKKRQQLRLHVSLSKGFHRFIRLHHFCWTLMSTLTSWRRGWVDRLTAQHALQCIIGILVWELWIWYGPLIMDMELSCRLGIILLPEVASGSFLAVVWLNKSDWRQQLIWKMSGNNVIFKINIPFNMRLF